MKAYLTVSHSFTYLLYTLDSMPSKAKAMVPIYLYSVPIQTVSKYSLNYICGIKGKIFCIEKK